MSELRVGSQTVVMLGDIVNVGMHSNGCNEDDCGCGGPILHVNLSQVNGSGCQITLPLRSWALVAAAVQRAVVEADPTMFTKVLDHLDANVQRPEPPAPPVVPPRWTDFMPFLMDGAEVVQGNLADFLGTIFSPVPEGDTLNRWVTIGFGKFHHVSEVDYAEGEVQSIRTSCGRVIREQFEIVQEANVEDLCKVCFRVAMAEP